MHGITNICLIVQYRSHTTKRFSHVKKYPPECHYFVHIMREFPRTKADQEETLKPAIELAEGQARQGTIEQYFTRGGTPRGKQSASDREEQQQLVHNIP